MTDHRSCPDGTPVGPPGAAGAPRGPGPVPIGPAEPPDTGPSADFGALFEAGYRRLVGQLYAIALDPRHAHDAVRDAYAQAWRRWSVVGRGADPTGWVRRVAVRSTMRRRVPALLRSGVRRPSPAGDDVGPRTAAILSALRRLQPPERRAIVLTYMAGVPVGEIAEIEHATAATVEARLARGRLQITESLADDLTVVLGGTPAPGSPR